MQLWKASTNIGKHQYAPLKILCYWNLSGNNFEDRRSSNAWLLHAGMAITMLLLSNCGCEGLPLKVSSARVSVAGNASIWLCKGLPKAFATVHDSGSPSSNGLEASNSNSIG